MRVTMKVEARCGSARRLLRAFTMIEIAIAIAVIGFALVAIIGILPMGLNVQRDNREDTIVNQDGTYFMDLIRFGRQGIQPDQGKALDFLTNYVESITIEKSAPPPGGSASQKFTDQNGMTNGQVILDLLCTPRYQPNNGYIITNTVTAIIRAMTGSAMEQNGANSQVAFKYQLETQLVPYSTTPLMMDLYTNYLVGITNTIAETNAATAENAWHFWQNSLHELKLTFSWPILGNNTPGPNRRYFRSTVAGRLREAPWGIDPSGTFKLYFVDPQTFQANTNTGFAPNYPQYPK